MNRIYKLENDLYSIDKIEKKIIQNTHMFSSVDIKIFKKNDVFKEFNNIYIYSLTPEKKMKNTPNEKKKFNKAVKILRNNNVKIDLNALKRIYEHDSNNKIIILDYSNNLIAGHYAILKAIIQNKKTVKCLHVSSEIIRNAKITNSKSKLEILKRL